MKTKVSISHDRLTLSAKNDQGGSIRATISRYREGVSGRGPGITSETLKDIMKRLDWTPEDKTNADRVNRVARELEAL